MQTKNQKSLWPWIMLLFRSLVFVAVQAVIASIFFWRGNPEPWTNSANWWPFTASIGSILTLLMLIWLFRREGQRYWSLLHIEKSTLGKDLLAILGILLLTIPIVMLPNIFLAKSLFGDQQIALDLLVQPLPMWVVVWSVILFPLSIALTELPNYFFYVFPHLTDQTKSPLLAGFLSSFWLAAQHMFLPFLPNGRFPLWRLGMFFPFAIFLAFILPKRRQLLPYMMIIHWLLDLSTAVLIVFVSTQTA